MPGLRSKCGSDSEVQWVAPVSSMSATRQGPAGDKTKPDTMGLYDGSRRYQGKYAACWA
jgi:hypothetical protein